jgi:tRNA(fMet)-specific endonuclease VapC
MRPFVYMLDTNILSDLVRHPAGAVTERVAEYGEESICTSIIVACELRFGVAKKGVPLLSNKIEEILACIAVLPFTEDADRRYAALRVHLEKAGTLIGPNDMLIAAHALAQGLTLITDNTNEFVRVPELLVKNWLRQRS